MDDCLTMVHLCATWPVGEGERMQVQRITSACMFIMEWRIPLPQPETYNTQTGSKFPVIKSGHHGLAFLLLKLCFSELCRIDGFILGSVYKYNHLLHHKMNDSRP